MTFHYVIPALDAGNFLSTKVMLGFCWKKGWIPVSSTGMTYKEHWDNI
ncbi:hypothetical protein [Wolbachia endosymbiont (group B) of Hofmannophila pseudospretella]